MNKFFKALEALDSNCKLAEVAPTIDKLFNDRVKNIIHAHGFPSKKSLRAYLVLMATEDLPNAKKALQDLNINNFGEDDLHFYTSALIRNGFNLKVISVLERITVKTGELNSILAIALCETGELDRALALFSSIQTENKERPSNLNYLLELYISLKLPPPADIVQYISHTALEELETRTLTMLMIRCWLNGDPEGFNQPFITLYNRFIQNQFPSSPTDRKLCVAWFAFLQHLIRARTFPTRNHKLPVYGVIGESHSVPWHGLQVELCGQQGTAISNLIFGAKSFHFKIENRNRFISLFERHVENLQKMCGSNLLGIILVVGEIDCRIDEGIIKAFEKGEQRLESIIEQTAKEYIAVVNQVSIQKSIRNIYIAGVPAPSQPNIEKLQATQMQSELVREVIQKFNDCLCRHALLNELKFIDFYAMTLGQDGWAKPDVHVDDVHLHPKLFANISKFIRAEQCSSI